MKKLKTALISFAVALAAVGAVFALVCYFLFSRPFIGAESAIPQSGAELTEGADGALALAWPEADQADDYLVELRDENGVLFSEYVDGTRCKMPGDLTAHGDVTLTVTPRVLYETPRGKFYRYCEKPLTASYPVDLPSFDGLSTDVDPDNDILTVTWNAVMGGVYTVLDESGKEIIKTDQGGVGIPFGANIPIPAKDETARFTLSCGLDGFGVEFKSGVTATVEMPGELLCDTALQIDIEDMGNNLYSLSWNETRGDIYEVFIRGEAENWRCVGVYTDQDGRSCVLGPLEPFESRDIRVIALGGCAVGENELAATPAETSVITGATTMHATIWVLKDLDIWADTSKSEKVGVATTDTSYCVMGEKDGFFLIYIDGAKGWIDSTYCLINLPDYMGTLAEYDIRNSYDSIYMVNDYGIPGITGTVIGGYEEVGLNYSTVKCERTVRVEADGEDADETDPGTTITQGEDTDAATTEPVYEIKEVEVERPEDFLVPLLYPTAQKVAAAALAAREDGYRLKIYDAYRPYIATRFLYDLTESLLSDEVPELVYSQMAGDMWEDYLALLTEPDGEDTSEGSGADVQEGSGADAIDSADAGDEEPPSEPRPSYYTVMTDGRYSLSAFLARSGSYHNLGVAVDLTLVSIETGEELRMQTSMHDLSWHSVLGFNTGSAELLAKYMTGSGLAPLSSEWWHFQDDELRGRVKDLSRRQDGVTRSGWMYDGTGWRYRTKDGELLREGIYSVNGIQYDFDALGYSNYANWEG